MLFCFYSVKHFALQHLQVHFISVCHLDLYCLTFIPHFFLPPPSTSAVRNTYVTPISCLGTLASHNLSDFIQYTYLSLILWHLCSMRNFFPLSCSGSPILPCLSNRGASDCPKGVGTVPSLGQSCVCQGRGRGEGGGVHTRPALLPPVNREQSRSRK